MEPISVFLFSSLLCILFRVVNCESFSDCHIKLYNEDPASNCGGVCSLDTGQPCFRKCCPLGQIYLKETCVEHKMSLEDIEVQMIDINKDEIDYTLRDVRNVIHGVPCRGVNTVFPVLKPFHVYTNGTLVMSGVKKNMNEYCGDVMELSDKLQVTFIYCFQPYIIPRPNDFLVITLLCISLPFLIATIVIRLLNEKDEWNLPKRIQISQLATMTIAFVLLIILNINEFIKIKEICLSAGYASHYSLMSNFFWLNVMCFDIWLVFSGYAVPYRDLSKYEERKKYMKYACYAWGVPLLISLLVLTADNTEILPAQYKPNVGTQSCLMSEKAMTIFYFTPLGIIILLNIIMFIHTAYIIHMHNRTMRTLRSEQSNISNPMEYESLLLYVKLFLVMGITWSGELLSKTFEGTLLEVIADSINSLQGVFIFIIFVCKYRTIRALNTKFCPTVNLLCCFRERRPSTYNTNTTLSRMSSVNKKSSRPSLGTSNASDQIEIISHRKIEELDQTKDA